MGRGGETVPGRSLSLLTGEGRSFPLQSGTIGWRQGRGETVRG